MLARVLLVLGGLQAVLIYVPPLAWPMWLAHFVALETCLIGLVTGLAAAWLTTESWARWVGIGVAIACALPGLLTAPLCFREAVPFSPLAWVGVGAPRARVDVDVSLSPELKADVYRPEGDGPHPWVLVVHGGSWRSGDKGDAPAVSHALAQAGFMVFDLRYRLAPAHPFPAGAQDVFCALGQIQSRAQEFGVDPHRGAVLGRSAGAQLAAVAGYAAAGIDGSGDTEALGYVPDTKSIFRGCLTPVSPVRAVVSIYGPVDLAWAHGHPFVPDVVDGTHAIETYLGGPPTAVPELYVAANPISWINAAATTVTLPATLIVHGTGERCVRPRNAEMLRDALRRRNHPVRTLLIPLADHGFDVRPGGFGEQLTRGVLLQFLREHVAS